MSDDPDDQQKPIPKIQQSESNPELKALAKALMVDLTWTMAAWPQRTKPNSQNQKPSDSND
ncbi:MAG: hypothetical protein WBA13_06575 [Microcoleaceae cyanobacterium]